mmetsp:Transcript_38483/g.90984  ORF Transcript_38483/g.90984 Transcript_38483/m.90984 type:complete len:223 (-) Transcript_38483:221-889(-)
MIGPGRPSATSWSESSPKWSAFGSTRARLPTPREDPGLRGGPGRCSSLRESSKGFGFHPAGVPHMAAHSVLHRPLQSWPMAPVLVPEVTHWSPQSERHCPAHFPLSPGVSEMAYGLINVPFWFGSMSPNPSESRSFADFLTPSARACVRWSCVMSSCAALMSWSSKSRVAVPRLRSMLATPRSASAAARPAIFACGAAAARAEVSCVRASAVASCACCSSRV